MKDAKSGSAHILRRQAGGSLWHVLGRRWKDSAAKAYGQTTFLRRCAQRSHGQTHRFGCNSIFFRVIQHMFFIVFYYSHESSLSWLFMIPSPSTVGFITGNAIRQNVQILSRPNQWVKGPMVSNLHIDLAHWVSMIQRTATYFCIKTFHSLDHLRRHCFAEKEIGDQKTFSRASGGSVAAAVAMSRYIVVQAMLNDDGATEESPELDTATQAERSWKQIVMETLMCGFRWFQVVPIQTAFLFLLHQAIEGVHKSQEDQYWEEMWDIAKTALFAAHLTGTDGDVTLSPGSPADPVLRRSEDRDEDEARTAFFLFWFGESFAFLQSDPKLTDDILLVHRQKEHLSIVFC